MADRRAANPRLLLSVAAVAGVIFSTIAIFIAAGYSPESGAGRVPAAPVTATSTPPVQPPPPPIMLPPPMPQVPCMGWTGEGCDPAAPKG